MMEVVEVNRFSLFLDSLKGPRVQTVLKFRTSEGIDITRKSSIRGWKNQQLWVMRVKHDMFRYGVIQIAEIVERK